MPTVPDEPTLLVTDLGPDVVAGFTGRVVPEPAVGDGSAVGQAGNMSAQRPHDPGSLADTRAAVAGHLGFDAADLHTMRQVHGATVGVVEESTPPGAQLRGIDAMFTELAGRPLAVMTADCVPVLLAARTNNATTVGVVHVGRRGLVAGMVEAAIAYLSGRGAVSVRAAIGPAIGGCCYEVPSQMADEVVRSYPDAGATASWGTPSLDLPAAVASTLSRAQISVVDVGECTACTPLRWFSHRVDPSSGRGAGIVMRRDGS